MDNTYVLSNGHSIEYRVYGQDNGYPVIGCHGLLGGVDVDGLDEQLEGTSLRYILIARPGYGKSDFYAMDNILEWAQEIKSLLDTLHVDCFDVLGMSAGAPYAYALAVAYPSKVKRVYIYSGIGALNKQEVLAEYPRSEQTEQVYKLFTGGALEDIGEFLYQHYIKPMPKEFLEMDVVQDAVRNRCIAMAQTAKLEYAEWGFEIESVEQPVFMYHSKADEEVPYGVALRTKEFLPNAALYTYEGESHQSQKMMDDVMTQIIGTCSSSEDGELV